MKRKKWKSAAEAMLELEKDSAFVERRQRREEALRQAEESDARAEAPIVEALQNAGVPATTVWDLVNTPNTYDQSLPVLFTHLQQAYPDTIRDGIARAMAVPAARFAWPGLLKLFGQEPPGRVKDGLAVALSNIADDDLLKELIGLIRDSRHGESRILLLSALERSRWPGARRVLMELGGDPQLHRQVQRILRRLSTKE